MTMYEALVVICGIVLAMYVAGINLTAGPPVIAFMIVVSRILLDITARVVALVPDRYRV